MKRRLIFSILLYALGGSVLFAQMEFAALDNGEALKEKRLLLAYSAEDYPVTPGDTFVLSYYSAGGFQSFEFVIRGDHTANLNIFGTVDARGATYLKFGRLVEGKVLAAYRESRPRCLLRAVGIFTVIVRGEVKMPARVECWGLTTLAEVVLSRTTDHSSLRRVEIRPAGDGPARVYDLFAALRFGKNGDNPYVRPGDVLVVGKASRRVTVRGEVYRPGTYELAEGENLPVVIEKYADGFIAAGDLGRVHVARPAAPDKERGDTFMLDAATDAYKNFRTADRDVVTVASKDEQLPVVYFEGAIGRPDNGKGASGEPSGRYVHKLTEGEYLSAAAAELKSLFSPLADLKHASIVRAGEVAPVAVDIEALLFSYDAARDVVLQPYDRIVIPIRQFFVTVSGAVFLPGRYAYVPDRNYRYYLQLAGGSDPQKNVNSTVVITDVNDAKQPLARVIQPEDKIFAEYNSALYYLQQWGAVIGTGISLTALVMSIIQLTRPAQ